MARITDRQIMDSITRDIGRPKRIFAINSRGFPCGEGVEIVDKTSKLNPYRNLANRNMTKVFLQTLKDGRRIRYTVEIERP